MKEKETTFYVDIPTRDSVENPDASWINIKSFDTEAEAIEFAIKYFGADENGMICIISKS